MRDGEYFMNNMPFKVHSVVLKDFINSNGGLPNIADERFLAGEGVYLIRQSFKSICLWGSKLFDSRTPCEVEGFSIAHTRDHTGWYDGIICVWDANAELVGGMAKGVPYVKSEFQGNGLGREIVLLAFEIGIKDIDDGVFFSPAGLACRKSVHRLSVQRALQKGEDVSTEVLADYPDLISEFSPHL
jgi:hypothetical protein